MNFFMHERKDKKRKIKIMEGQKKARTKEEKDDQNQGKMEDNDRGAEEKFKLGHRRRGQRLRTEEQWNVAETRLAEEKEDQKRAEKEGSVAEKERRRKEVQLRQERERKEEHLRQKRRKKEVQLRKSGEGRKYS